MRNYQKTLVELNQEIPALEQTKEGLFKGGFCAMPLQGNPLETKHPENNNYNNAQSCTCSCVNDGCNDGCVNDGCNEECTNNQCTTKSTVPGNGLTVGPVSGSLMF